MSRQPFDRRSGERRRTERADARGPGSTDRRAGERRRGAGRRDLDTLLDVTRRLMTLTDLDALLRVIADACAEDLLGLGVLKGAEPPSTC